MRNATLRKLVIIVSSVAALGGGLGIDTAYAQGGGGFDRGGGGIAHMGVGFGGGHMGGFGEGHIGGEFGSAHPAPPMTLGNMREVGAFCLRRSN